MKTKLFIAACVFVLALLNGGCMGPGTLTKAAKTIKNKTIIIKANTPWGPQTYIGLNDTNTTVIVSVDGTVSINPQPSQGVFIAPTTTTTTTLEVHPATGVRRPEILPR